MSESLSTINIEQLSDAVRSALNSNGRQTTSSRAQVNSGIGSNVHVHSRIKSTHAISHVTNSLPQMTSFPLQPIRPVQQVGPVQYLVPVNGPVLQPTLRPVGQNQLQTFNAPLNFTLGTPNIVASSQAPTSTLILAPQATQSAVFIPSGSIQSFPQAIKLTPSFTPQPVAKTLQTLPINIQTGLQQLPTGGAQLISTNFIPVSNSNSLHQPFIQSAGTQLFVQPTSQQFQPPSGVQNSQLTPAISGQPSNNAPALSDPTSTPLSVSVSAPLLCVPTSGSSLPVTIVKNSFGAINIPLSPPTSAVLDGSNTTTISSVPGLQMSADSHCDSRTITSSPGAQSHGVLDSNVLDLLFSPQGVQPCRIPPTDQPPAAALNDNNQMTADVGNFCCQCMKCEDKPCSIHEMEYSLVRDTPIIPRARASLPNTVSLKPSNLFKEDFGVWTKSKLSCNTVFSPLIGRILDGDHPKLFPSTYVLKVVGDGLKPFPSPYIWKVFEDSGICLHCIDCTSEEDSNWLRYMKKARSTEEQNVIVYQHGKNICFITCSEVPENTELLYWYSTSYAKHLEVPSQPDQSHQCRVCEKTFTDGAALKNHYRYTHPDTSTHKWKCAICNRPFRTSSKLETHMFIHMGLKPFKCGVCDKTFTDASNLRTHKTIHADERKFECSVCHRKFRQKAHMKSHEMTHAGIIKTHCRYCHKGFSRAFDCKLHENTHTKAQKLVCSKCGRIFYRQSSLKKHMQIHDGIRNYNCEDCGKKFYTKYHVTRHKKSCKGPSEARNQAKPKPRKKGKESISPRRSIRKKKKTKKPNC